MKTFKLLFIFALAFLLSFFSITISAHSGKTDYKGGHRDSKTGEYHYHHGYPEHQHEDTDGDGVLDCPYDFDDNENNANKNSGRIEKDRSSPTVNNSKSNKTSTYKDSELKELTLSSFVQIILCSAFASFMISCLIIGVSFWIISLIEEKSKKKFTAVHIEKNQNIVFIAVLIASFLVMMFIMLQNYEI